MPTLAEILKKYESEPLKFSGEANASYERHLIHDHVVDPSFAHTRHKFEAIAHSIRDLLVRRWLKTRSAHYEANPKRVYYLSMEFLIGRSLTNNITNLMVDPIVQEVMRQEKLDLMRLAETEPDAGLGNGGLGRLAACFIDSLATLQIPAVGYGLRYEYGIFKQDLTRGFQVERPDNWLLRPDPWEVPRPEGTIPVKLGSAMEFRAGQAHLLPGTEMTLFGVPYDRPVVGYGGHCINTLRLWRAATPDYFNFGEFNTGDFFAAVSDKVVAETLTRVLYPDDSTASGRSLRFVQEYFLVACSLADIISRFRRSNDDWSLLPDKVAIQLNDTHPAMAVSELMVILLDQVGLSWDEAWDLTTRTLAYTNHTLLPEALEKWPIEMFERLLPRHLAVIYEINRRFLDEVRVRFPNDDARLARMSLIEETPARKVRMANLAIIGSHSTNGVAAIHSELLKTRVVRDFAEMYPERFNNKTNGVTPRRWLLMANPHLSKLITETIGDGWITNLEELAKLKPLAEDAAFRARFRQAKRAAKTQFSQWLRQSSGQVLDPDTIFDCQVKRIHEYKRQLLNALHIVVLYNRLRQNPSLDMPPRTFLFAGKAAPAYTLAKLIIKFINNLAATIDANPALKGKLKVVFLPNYSVTLSERLIPAADVSEQISTAGYEASGTSNMKFMMNGALTIGTRDGATIEMAQAAGEENFFLFGLNADEVAKSRGFYNPWWHVNNEPETRTALDLIFNDHFSPEERGIFAPLRETLLTKGDYYMHLADLTAYVRAQEQVGRLYRDQEAWSRQAVLNVAASGWFSSDRTIRQYAEEIWGAKSVPVQ
ncbi:MAG: glycogen/starch/alpha-glucan phosphorylase [Gemmataceae bacterium]